MTATPPKRRRIKFAMEADEGCSIFVAGTFNDWSESQNRLKYRDGRYELNMLLHPGRYEYKFKVDDTWCVDPACPDWSPNEHGSLNSVLIVE